MAQPEIRECANSDCTNTWEIRNEDDTQHEVCGECEVETQAQTPMPTPESEGYGETEPE